MLKRTGRKEADDRDIPWMFLEEVARDPTCLSDTGDLLVRKPVHIGNSSKAPVREKLFRFWKVQGLEPGSEFRNQLGRVGEVWGIAHHDFADEVAVHRPRWVGQ